jgi:aldehyde:ferredoxin oxidoreductase
MDTISTGSVIAFAMDLFDRGILTADDTGGLDLAWGDGEIMETLIRQMAAGEGLGGLLAQGVKRAAAAIGRGADAHAAHVKGLELTAYHPGTILGTALGYMVSSRGGDYNNVYASLEHNWSPEKADAAFGTPKAVDIHSPEGKGRLVRRAVLVNIVVDCLGVCKVPALSLLKTFDLESEARLASAITGYGFTAEGLMETGEKIAAMERLFNLLHGPEDFNDRLPPMFLKGDNRLLSEENLRMMLGDFFEAMGWDKEGRPTPETLTVMGLSPAEPPASADDAHSYIEFTTTNATRKDDRI